MGTVTAALDRVPVGAVIGVRGPFGTTWDPEGAEGGDVVVVAGGVGLAPLRPLIRQVLAGRDRYRQVDVLIGARTPDDLLFAPEEVGWQGREDVHARVTVDRAGPSWTGPVGVVTTLVDAAPFEPGSTTAFVCGPEAMMRYASRALLHRGMDPGRIRLSTERNMRCAVAHCGHCQLGPVLVCRDGPVMTQRVLATAHGGAGTMTARPAPAPRRGVEVRVVRRLPAHPARLRGRAAGPGRPVDLAHFLEAGPDDGGVGPYDLSIVEGSITTEATTPTRIRDVRASPAALVTIGACATAGGIQALRNFADVEEYTRVVYATPAVHLHPRHVDRRSRTTSRSTSSSGAAPSTATSCWRSSTRSSTGDGPRSRPTACAWSARCAAPCA